MLYSAPPLYPESKRRRTGRSAVPILLLMLAIIRPDAAFALSIDTTTGWNGTDNVCCFGESNTATYGQTLTADATEFVLNSFTFFLDDMLNTDTVEFEAYVYAWNGSHAIGSAVFQSSPLATTNNGGADGYEAIAVATGGVALAPGQQYVLFLSASNLFDGTNGTARWGATGPGANSPDTLPGGNFVFQNNGSNFATLTTNAWAIRQGDLAFRAEFSPIPEPNTALLFGLGLAGLAGVRRAPFESAR